jgi:hypothetical protein
MHSKYFNKAGQEVPSVTTVLKILNKPSLINWANYLGFKRQNVDNVLKSSAEIGSFIHDLAESVIRGNYPVYKIPDEFDKNLIKIPYANFLNWYNKNALEPILIEKGFATDNFGGTFDFYGKLNGNNTLIDFKTSKNFYMSQFIQLSGYILLLEENEYSIDQVTILLINTKGCFEKTIQRDSMSPYIRIFKLLVWLFHEYNGLSEHHQWGEKIG